MAPTRARGHDLVKRRSSSEIANAVEHVVHVVTARSEGVRAKQIPLCGVNHSLPVTVAAGIVMHAWARIRYAEGSVA
jgi:hypothetical protein